MINLTTIPELRGQKEIMLNGDKYKLVAKERISIPDEFQFYNDSPDGHWLVFDDRVLFVLDGKWYVNASYPDRVSSDYELEAIDMADIKVGDVVFTIHSGTSDVPTKLQDFDLVVSRDDDKITVKYVSGDGRYNISGTIYRPSDNMKYYKVVPMKK
jgi:hypothetical protein